MQRVEVFIKGQHILYDAAAVTNIEPGWFEPHYWRERNALNGEATGRGTSYFFGAGGMQYVLRHYRRGGLMARVLSDRYLRGIALSNTRAWREWDILARLWQEGLPVPRPVAARVIFDGLFYRADIITARLPAQTTLAQILRTRALTKAEWEATGRLIRLFHEAGVYHADMNAHNILYSADRMYLIDFDNSCICRNKFIWPQRTLSRLHRSLCKLACQDKGLHFTEADWKIFLLAYRAGL
ncbi:MAG TPA: 3-deoxy-D-manno-octulosonic acid kinase [Gammaproteobacteria bacterium]